MIPNNMLSYTMRDGENPDPEIEEIERGIMQQALNAQASSPRFAQKSLKWIYNFFHFHNLYGNCNYAKHFFSKRPYPTHIEVEVSTLCNLKCTMCEHTYWKHEPMINMGFENFVEIIEQFPQLKQIGLTGIGYSYANPRYMDMINYCTKKEIVMELFDTFNLLDFDKQTNLLNSSAYKVYCSCDAATKETYEKIRVNAKWDSVMENLKQFAARKRMRKQYYPELAFHFIISKENIHEVLKYIDMVHELDIDVSFIQFSRLLHAFPEIKDTFVDIPQSLIEESIEKGKKLGITVSWNMNTTENDKKSDMSSCVVWEQPFIFVDGTVIPCCSLNEQNDRDWQRDTSLGNIFQTPMRDIWAGEKYKVMLDSMQNDKTCNSCSRCQLYRREQ